MEISDIRCLRGDYMGNRNVSTIVIINVDCHQVLDVPPAGTRH